MEARGPGWVNRVELLAGLLPATLLLAPFVLTGAFGIVVAAVTVLPHPQRPLGEGLSHLHADAFFLLLALGAVLGLASLRPVVVLGREDGKPISGSAPGRELLDPVRSDGGLLLADLDGTARLGTISSRGPREFCYSAVPS